MALSGQTNVGIVLTQKGAILRTTGKHSVGFIGAFGDQIINQHPNVGFASLKHNRSIAHMIAMCIDPCHEPLSGRFFITRCAVDLPSKEKAFDQFSFQTVFQLKGWEIIVFDCVTRTKEFYVFKTGNFSQGLKLNILGKRGGKSIDIVFNSVPTFGFYKNLMTVFVGKTIDFVFNGGTVAWACTFDRAIEHGASIKART